MFKWEKSRNKIIAELTLNKKKQNTGDGRPIRKRRRIHGNDPSTLRNILRLLNFYLLNSNYAEQQGTKCQNFGSRKK